MKEVVGDTHVLEEERRAERRAAAAAAAPFVAGRTSSSWRRKKEGREECRMTETRGDHPSAMEVSDAN